MLPAVSNFSFLISVELPVSAAVGTPTAVKTTSAAMETAATVEAGRAAVEASVDGSACHRCAMNGAMVRNADRRTADITASSIVASASVVATSIIATTIVTGAVESVEPGPGADKDATNEPLRTIVAIRSASIGVISVVAIIANRRNIASVPGANSDPHYNLRMGRSCCRKDENS
jgi:hypothetical protein